MSREVTSDTILARLAALTAWPASRPPAGVRGATAAAARAIATGSARLRLLETDRLESSEAEADWRDRSQEAVERAAKCRREGATQEAERLEEVARMARRRQEAYQVAADAAGDAILAQEQVIDELRDAVAALRARWDRPANREMAGRALPPR